ncbi:MATE family efflux transporter [Lentibacter sp. XHP0401]|uniref:MATE family efflux transporter n=1 Tax=Lentibacter sp. XHP0401 TaxID=2984334 RepID=UPI0021E96398|nr:MATE family efflux transporter [Lentibacter sp. XHP0401]MCV2893292.1 MATE family efflux transporter [Lentibacter sp. XHP0401]
MQGTTRDHIKAYLVLGLPLVGSHVAQMMITLIDTVMLGWYSVDALAAQVLAGTIFFVFFIFGSGFAWAVMPKVASAEGAGDERQARRVTRMGLWASIMFGVLVMPIFIFAEPVLLALGQEPGLAALGADYLMIAGWGIFPALMVMTLKSFLAALEKTQAVLWITIAAVFANALVNYMLIFGNWGAPELGIEGAAWASLVVQVLSFVLIVAYAQWATPEHQLFVRFWRADWEAFGEVFRLGWPIGITSLAEVGLFAASSVMMGWLGTLQLAAHGIALQVTSLAFMVHLGLSNAATVRAGRAYGRGDIAALRHGGYTVFGMSIVVAVVTVIVFLTLPEVLLGAFLDPTDPDTATVMLIGVGLLAAAALFQLVDAAQVMALGILRGVQDTRVPMVIAGVAYWIVGVPVSYLLGITFGLGGVGIWLGLAIGLAVAAVLLIWRFLRWQPKGIA